MESGSSASQDGTTIYARVRIVKHHRPSLFARQPERSCLRDRFDGGLLDDTSGVVGRYQLR
jgi:hypothetical protein